MKSVILLLAGASLGLAAAVANPTAAPAAAATVPEMERIMVTGSLQDAADQPVEIERYMVTGSLQDGADQPVEIERYMVTGSLQDPVDQPVEIERYMVTGSLADEKPARLKLQGPRARR